SEQPDEAVPRVSPLQAPHRVDGVASAFALLEIADADARALRHPFGGSEPAREGRHVLRTLLQGIAGRNQPPDFIETEHAHRLEADPPVRPMRRVEGTAEKADARHGR